MGILPQNCKQNEDISVRQSPTLVSRFLVEKYESKYSPSSYG